MRAPPPTSSDSGSEIFLLNRSAATGLVCRFECVFVVVEGNYPFMKTGSGRAIYGERRFCVIFIHQEGRRHATGVFH